MLDRQKLEAILAHRFPTAATAQLAAAANAIIGLVEDRAVDGATRMEGPQPSTTTITVAADIDAPIHRVFDAFTDIERAPEHLPSIKRVEMLTSGSFGLGTRWRETREVFGHLETAEKEVIAFVRDRTCAVSHDEADVHVEMVIVFEPDGTQTRVTIEFTLDAVGLPSGSATPVDWAIAGKVRHTLSRDLADLKDHLERAVR